MIMKYFNQKTKHNLNEKDDTHPTWISSANASFDAWKFTEQLKKQKIQYIITHSKPTHFTLKTSYQIKPSEVAKGIKINRSTLMHTSSYSRNFSIYLKEVNEFLLQMRDKRFTDIESRNSRGSIRNTKDQLLFKNEELKQKLELLERTKTQEIVKYAFDQLPLPVKRKLGLD